MVEWIDPSRVTIPAAILQLVPAHLAREKLVLPIRIEGEELIIAAADPFNEVLFDRLRFMANREVIRVGSPRDKLVLAIWRNYGPPDGD